MTTLLERNIPTSSGHSINMKIESFPYTNAAGQPKRAGFVSVGSGGVTVHKADRLNVARALREMASVLEVMPI